MAEQNEIEVLKSLIIALKDSFDNFKENVAVKFEDLLAEAAIRKESRAMSLLRSDVSPQNNYSSGEEVGGQLLNFTNSPGVVPPGDKMFWAPSVEFKRKSDAMDAKWCGSKPDDVLELMRDESNFLDLLETHHPELYRLRKLYYEEDSVLSVDNGNILKDIEFSSLKGAYAPKLREVLKSFCFRMFNEYSPSLTGGSYARYKERTNSVAKYVCLFLFGKNKKDNSVRTTYTRLVVVEGSEKAKSVEHTINEKGIASMIRKFQKNKGDARLTRFKRLVLADEESGAIPAGFFKELFRVKSEKDSDEDGEEDEGSSESPRKSDEDIPLRKRSPSNKSNENKENCNPQKYTPMSVRRPDMANGPSAQNMERARNTIWHKPKATKTDKDASPGSGVMISATLQEWERMVLQNV